MTDFPPPPDRPPRHGPRCRDGLPVDQSTKEHRGLSRSDGGTTPCPFHRIIGSAGDRRPPSTSAHWLQFTTHSTTHSYLTIRQNRLHRRKDHKHQQGHHAQQQQCSYQRPHATGAGEVAVQPGVHRQRLLAHSPDSQRRRRACRLRGGVHQLAVHDQSMTGRIFRMTGCQGDEALRRNLSRMLWHGICNIYPIWGHNLGARDSVRVVTILNLDDDGVTGLQFIQTIKRFSIRGPMPRDHEVPDLTGHRRTRDMPRSATQVRRRDALHDDGRVIPSKPRNPKNRDTVTEGHRRWGWCRPRRGRHGHPRRRAAPRLLELMVQAVLGPGGEQVRDPQLVDEEQDDQHPGGHQQLGQTPPEPPHPHRPPATTTAATVTATIWLTATCRQPAVRGGTGALRRRAGDASFTTGTRCGW